MELTNEQYYEKYIRFKAQNDLFNSQIKNIQENYTKTKSQSLYKTEKVLELQKYNFILFIIFYICVLILALYFLLLNRTQISFRIKIFIIILFIFYPFLIDIIQQYLYFIYLYVYAFISGVAYVPELL